MCRKIYAACLKCLFSLTLLISTTVTALGQSSSAAVNGVVEDATNARIPNASVKLINADTGTESSITTDKDGNFSIPSVLPGRYRLQIEREGFDTTQLTGITLNIGDNKSIIVRMKVGSPLQTVTVDGSGIEINTTNGSVSTVVDRQFVENLPLNGRSFQSLLYLAPGVTFNMNINNNTTQGQFVVNGQRSDANYWMVDGVSGNVGMGLVIPGAALSGGVGATNALGGTSALVSVDALQEFRVETSTYAPEYGRAPGGQISLQTRSGTNNFHGVLFNYLRNGDLDANDWFADHDALSKPLEIQNDFGGVLGGPILKDRTFFFFSYEGLRLRLPETFTGTVPDLPTRASAVPAVKPYLDMYPLPRANSQEVSGGCGAEGCGYVTYYTTFSDPATSNSYSLRIDHQLRKNLTVFGRYSHTPSSVMLRGNDAGAANDVLNTHAVTKTATAGATWSISSLMVDDLRFNYSVSGGKAAFVVDNYGGGTPFPGNLLGSGLTYATAEIDLLPNFGTNMREANGLFANQYQHQINVVDTMAVQKGAHSLKFGVDYRRLTPFAYTANEQLFPLFQSMPQWAAGISNETDAYLNAPAAYLLKNLSAFAQDTWRVTPRLNLTYGVRWDVDFLPSVQKGLGFAVPLVGFNSADLANLGIGPAGTPPYKTRYSNFAPRIGGAYRFLNNSDWAVVLRGGFGLFYAPSSTETYNQNWDLGLYPVGAYKPTASYTDPQGVYYPYVPFPTPASVAALPVLELPNAQNGETLYGVDPNLNLPYALEWNAAVEQSLGKSQSFALTYIGAADRRLLLSEDVTNPNPNFAGAYLIGNAGYSNYQAMQARFQRQLSNGLQALVSYTWSHSIDTGTYGAYANGSLADVNANRGDSDNDARNIFSGAVTYQLPILKSNAFTRFVTGGWATDDIVQIRAGSPVDIQDGNFAAVEGANSTILIRPDMVPGQPRYLTGSQYPGRKAINPASLMDPPTGPDGQPTRQGNLPRNACRDLGLAQWDFAARREFQLLPERVKLQFRAELFNVLNHPNFGPFNNNFRTNNIVFGQASQMLNQYLGGYFAGGGQQNPLYTPGSPRSGELALRLIF